MDLATARKHAAELRQLPVTDEPHLVTLTLAAALDAVEHELDTMNAGWPGWYLRDRIRAALAEVQS